MSQDHEANPGSSAFLTILTQLSDDAWAQVLLPQLQARGCLAAVALTCSQLRDLCYSTVAQVDLQTLHSIKDPLVLGRYTQNLGAHFLTCSSVKLRLQEAGNYHCMPYVLPSLRSLPKLNGLDLIIEGRLEPLLMGTLLMALRTQLVQVQSLILTVHQAWCRASLPWHELGCFAQLTSLTVDFGDQVTRPVRPADLTPLSQLINLQQLQIRITAEVAHSSVGRVLTPELLQPLTALTSLCCSGGCSSALQLVGSCTALQSLLLKCKPNQGVHVPEPADWTTVGHLTALTRLELCSTHMVTASDSFCSALSQLAGLEVFHAGKWSPELLPVLATSPKLRCLGGGWLPRDVPGALQLPRIRDLEQVHGCVPLCAFPGVTSLQQTGPVSPDLYQQLRQYCKGLVALRVPSDSLSLQPQHEASQRTAAIRALSGLTNLKQLVVGVYDDAEAAVFAQVVAALTQHNLESACMFVPSPGRPGMSPSSLMLMAQVAGLRNFYLDARSLELDVLQVRMLLQACHGISYVCVTVLPDKKDAFEDAQSWLQEAGLWQHQLQTLTFSGYAPETVLELV